MLKKEQHPLTILLSLWVFDEADVTIIERL